MLAAVVLRAPATITADYFGQRHTAEVLDDATIRYAGSSYPSLSAAGIAVKLAVRGADLPDSVKATDGWGSGEPRIQPAVAACC